MAGLGLVQSLAVITHYPIRLPGALVTAAVVLGVPVTKSGVPANTIFLLLGTNVATPEPALFVGTLGWVAAGVAGTISLDVVASVGTCPIAGNPTVFISNGKFTTIAGFLLWQTDVPTLVPSILIGTVLKVAAEVTCCIFLGATVGIYAGAVAEYPAVIVQGGVGFAATAVRILWHANVITPEPTLVIRAVFRVAGHVASSIILYLVVARTAVEDTIITGCWCRVVIV